METTQDIMDDICAIAGIKRVRQRRGSTEPREFWWNVADALQVSRVSATGVALSKPEIARAIVEGAGQPWDSRWDGSLTDSGGGGSISNEGLQAVRTAARRLVKRLPD